nr:MAG TPA: hypothetical protein [Caudoviricetes sp.]
MLLSEMVKCGAVQVTVSDILHLVQNSQTTALKLQCINQYKIN